MRQEIREFEKRWEFGKGLPAFLHSRILAFSALALLAACGFQPLHGKAFRESNAVNTAMVSVETDATHLGQLLKAEIEDQVNPNYQPASKPYRLKIVTTEVDVALFINPDGTSSRGDLQFNSNYTLLRVNDGKIITKGSIQRVSSYNTSQNADYASFVSQQDARTRGILELAQDYKLRIANLISTLNTPTAEQPTVPKDEPAAPPIIHTQYDNETRAPGF